MYETSAKLRRILRRFVLIRGGISSGRGFEPSPRVMRPSRSTTVTSPTCLVLTLAVTNKLLPNGFGESILTDFDRCGARAFPGLSSHPRNREHPRVHCCGLDLG